MLRAFINVWKIPDLRSKLLFTLGMLVIYRIGFWIPLPGVSQESLTEFFKNQGGDGSAIGHFAQFVSMFTGGALGQSTLFGLGIMPYISAAIIFQLLTTVVPTFEQLQKEGPGGRQKIQEYTRYATVGLCLIQSVFYLQFFRSQDLIHPEFYWDYSPTNASVFWACGIFGMTTGTVILMWLGEQIDKYGIGSGASLIITAGILSRIPSAINQAASTLAGAPLKWLALAAAFVAVVAGTVLITQGQRRIPVQQAKHTRGRRVYGGQRSYLPLRVNHGGVMPIIFASSLMMFPSVIFGFLAQGDAAGVFGALQQWFRPMKGTLYIFVFIGMIYFFAYFWTSVQFQPREMATQLRDHGSFIPGLRPGPRTAEYLERVMERITYVGGGFLAVIAVVPSVVNIFLGVRYMVASFLGGTALLITVSVILDFVQRIEANLVMRNYQGFLADPSGSGKGPRIRGPGSR